MTTRTIPRVDADLLADAARRITTRDRYIARMCHEHRVLTTRQIAQLAFGSETTAQHRLAGLARLRVLDRIRPFTQTGSAPWHHVLGPAGAHILAAEDGLTIGDLGYRRDHAISYLYSRQLPHSRGLNSFFTTLTAYARDRSEAELITWWGERRCQSEFGTYARPDAYATWREDGETISFYLEYDNGTEPLDRLLAKLDTYVQLADQTGSQLPVLFWLQGPRREAHLRQRLQAHLYGPVATAHFSPAISDQPAGPVWLPNNAEASRVRLVRLTRSWPTLAAPAPFE